MKLGVFDSGLGGLLITKAIRDSMPDRDILYLGDTLHLPYGKRSEEAIYTYTKRCMDFMFEQGCGLIIIACNTASAAALRRLQQEYLPTSWPGRNIIGVVVPTLEEAIGRGYKKLGLIGTDYIIGSNIYHEELIKISPDIEMVQQATPLLVPLIENDGMAWVDDVLRTYLAPLVDADIECLILGCTHYPFLRPQIRARLPDECRIIAQDEIIPDKLSAYLKRHPGYADNIGRGGASQFYVSDLTHNYQASAEHIYGGPISIEIADLHE